MTLRTIQALRSMSVALAGAVLLVACGGGGSSDGAGSTGNSSTPATPAGSGGSGSTTLPAFSLSTSAVTVQGDTGVDGIAPIDVAIRFAGSATPVFYAKWTWAGTAIEEANSVVGGGLTGNNIELLLYRPGQLGAGTYIDTLTVTVCADTNCAQQFPGSPGTVRVSYTVTGSATPTTTFSLGLAQSIVIAHTGDTVAPTVTAQVLVNDLPPAGAYIRWRKPSGGVITDVSFKQSICSLNCVSPAWGTFTFTLQSPGLSPSGTYTDSLSFDFCFDAACTRPLPNSPATVVISYMVLLTPGKEYNSLSVALPANDVAWNPQDQLLYATVPTGPAQYANSIVQVNPISGAIGASLTFPSSPSRLAISDDGQFAYVNLPDQNLVQRVRLANLTADISIPMGVDVKGQPLKAVRMAIAPGAPHTLAVALTGPVNADGVAVFDDAVPRSQRLAALDREYVNSMAWGSSAATLYVSRYAYPPTLMNFDTVNVSGNGLNITTVNDGVFFNAGYTQYSEIAFAGGRLFENSGNVYDAVSGARLASFGLSYPAYQFPIVLPDAALGKAFAMYTDNVRLGTVLTVFDSNSFQQQTGLAQVPNFNGTASGTHLIRWGQRGLAAANGTNIVVLSGAIVAP
jgi:hypothetical protein